MKIRIERKDVRAFQRVAAQCFAAKIPTRAVRRIILSNKAVQVELLYGGLDDTTARDAVANAIVASLPMPKCPKEGTVLLRGRGRRWHWPVTADSKKYTTEFAVAYDRALTARGWSLLGRPRRAGRPRK